MSGAVAPRLVVPWEEANLAYLRAEVERLRISLDEPGEIRSRALARWRDGQDDRLLPFAVEGTPPAIESLVRTFGLTDLERDLLLLCLAPEIDPGMASRYAAAEGGVPSGAPTAQLVAAMVAFPGDAAMIRASLAPDAPLRHFELVSVDGGSSSGTRPIRLDPRVADLLLGVDRPDERATELLRSVGSRPLTTPHRFVVDELVARLARPSPGASGAVNLHGRAGSGRRAVAAAAAARMGLTLHEVQAHAFPEHGEERRRAFRVLEREAVLEGLAYYVDLDTLDPRPPATGPGDEVVRRLGVLVFLGSEERWRGEGDVPGVEVPRPDAEGRVELWASAMGGVAPDWVGAVAQQFELGPRAVLRAVREASERARRRGAPAATDDDAWASCRAEASGSLDDLAERLVPAHGWDDAVLPPAVTEQLRDVTGQVASRRVVYETWGFGRKLGRGRGITALFSGPSGTGKTMAAEILAGELDLDLFRVDLAGVVSKYIGETEKNLRRVFDAAEQSGAILFFDEADALFGKRSEVKDSHDRYANIEIDYLLQRMEDYRGLAILATNRKSLLDQAFLRRLRFLVDFPMPPAALRREIWRKVFPPDAPVGALDWNGLARLELAGGNIKNIALNAAFLAAERGSPIEMEHVLRAARREYDKLEKLLQPAEFGPYFAEVAR